MTGPREPVDEDNPFNTPKHCEHGFSEATISLGWVGTGWSAPIHIDLGPIFKKIQLSSPVMTSRKPMYNCTSRTLRSAFAPSTRFLWSSSVSMYGTHLKWRHWKPRDLVTCSQISTFEMCRSSLNVRNEENRASSSRFKIAASTSSSGGLPHRSSSSSSSSTETRLVLNSWT
jgi:hypothetical protein